MENVFYMDLTDMFPSQLFLNREKIKAIQDQINPFVLENIPPISIRKFGNKIVFLDGHTRAFLAHENGLSKVPVYWETEEYDWELYEICIQWCQEEKILHISELKNKILEKKSFEKLWIGKCNVKSEELEKERKKEI
ncbi:MAG: hypothetical protein ACTSYI_03025 [Promethearchaeota archaeon]